MKKLLLAAIVTFAISTGLSAQTTTDTTRYRGTNKNNPGYVDNNKNNVCDNYENGTRAYAGRGQGQGRRGAGYGMIGNRQGCINMQYRRGGNGRFNF
ncbi:MAG: hypothetical protein ACM3VS_13280 [Candidatus Dadabacteria bacterium]